MKTKVNFFNIPTLVFLVAGIFFISKGLVANDINISKPAAWVVRYDYETSQTTDNAEGGYMYLHLESQVNLIEETKYAHHTIKLLNLTGVQTFSTINAEYDPSYQQLIFHHINIVRNGQTIDKLAEAELETVQREAQMERHLYDGSLTTFVNLKDVRENDIIDYAYSIVGFNPISRGNFGLMLPLQFQIPVGKAILRIISAKDKPLYYKLLNSAPEPEIIEDAIAVNYIWEVESMDHIPIEVNTPAWYNPFKSVQITSFDSWEAVVNWALPLYNLSQNDLVSLRSVALNAKSKEETLLQTIQWVQDEVRYLGLESGIGAYKPNKPIEVFLHRYGDCKDKSLLLVALLRNEGIEAYPMLVSMTDGKNLPDYLPDYRAFDHVVVSFHFEGKDYYVDPTMSYLGGGIREMYFPDYKYGLLIKQGENELTKIPQPVKQEIHMVQKFTFDSIGGNASMTVETIYRNATADTYRQTFKANTISEIQRLYLDFYSHYFPEIEVAKNLSITDERNFSNIFITNESYTIYDAWEKVEDSETIMFSFYALVTESYVDYVRSPRRSMPYLLMSPVKFTKHAIFIMPKEWPVEKHSARIYGNGYSFIHDIDSKRNVVHANYEYNIDKDFLEPHEVRTYIDDHEKMFDSLHYEFYSGGFSSDDSRAYLPVIIAFVALALGIFLATTIYRKYDPPAMETEWEQKIGGWMILPLIGLFISPILLVKDIFVIGFFDPEMWADYTNTTGNLQLLLAAELMVNILIIVFTILVLVLFLNRRTSLPRVISIFFIARVAIVGLDFLAIKAIAPELITGEAEYESIFEIVVPSVAAIIWVSYFNLSERVKDTFVKRYDESNPDEGKNEDAVDFSVKEKINN